MLQLKTKWASALAGALSALAAEKGVDAAGLPEIGRAHV